MNVNPGELKKKIQIVRFVEEEDECGFAKEKKTVIIRKTRAKVTRTSIKEAETAGREVNEIKCRFLVRYTPTEITRDMFVLYKDNYYQIEYANNYGDSNEYIEIMTATEVV